MTKKETFVVGLRMSIKSKKMTGIHKFRTKLMMFNYLQGKKEMRKRRKKKKNITRASKAVKKLMNNKMSPKVNHSKTNRKVKKKFLNQSINLYKKAIIRVAVMAIKEIISK